MSADILMGRESESAELRGLLDRRQYGSGSLFLIGEAGIGKTAMLNGLRQYAARDGFRTLSISGRGADRVQPLAGLRRLLMQTRPDAGPAASRFAEPPAGAMFARALARLTERSPVLVTIDDAHQVDRASLRGLAFAASQLGGLRRLTLVLATRGPAAPAGFDGGCPELRLPRLSAAAAAAMLDQLPAMLRGYQRERVLTAAEGIPQALIEFADGAIKGPRAGRCSAVGPLAPSGRLSAEATARFEALPEETRNALLLAAVAEDCDLMALSADPGALVPAEEQGLVQVDGTRLRFTHPLVRAAVYHSVPFAVRAAAHRRLADALSERPHRRAWHVAAGSLGADECAARLLEATIERPPAPDAVACARALHRAADLSAAATDKARRLVAAAEHARIAGRADWVADLATEALELTDEGILGVRAFEAAGWAHAWTSRPTLAFAALSAAAREAAARDAELAWRALGAAALVVCHTNDPLHRDTVADLFSRAPGDAFARAQRSWIGVCADPYRTGRENVADLKTLAAQATRGHAPIRARAELGTSAWFLDEPELAVNLLRDTDCWTTDSGSICPVVLFTLSRALVDTGRWEEALTVASNARDYGRRHGLDLLVASARAVFATVHALRGDVDTARAAATGVHDGSGSFESRLLDAEAQRALALAADAEDEYLLAHLRHSRLLEDHGALHPRVALMDLADFAAAAVRADEIVAARGVVEGVAGRLTGPYSPRLTQILARARGLLADSDTAEAHFAAGLAVAGAERWPLERAQLRYDFGVWLRRARRTNEGKPHLTAALETFQSLGAQAWAKRAESELRASRVNLSVPATTVDVLAELTPQQREVVVLAGQGMTNEEIAKRLFLSPRTVASHLYRSYPKLGVSRRHQLRGVLDEATRI